LAPHGFLNFRSLSAIFIPKGAVVQNPFRSPKIIFDHSKVRFTANPKLAFQAQTLDLRPFRFTENGFQKFFNIRSRDMGKSPKGPWHSSHDTLLFLISS
jgi:hypothetical protein